MKSNPLFQGEIAGKESKYTENLKTKSSPETAGQFQSSLVQIILR
jgi:hypothetical protein